MLFVCYPKCGTCQKAKKWLDANGIVYTVRYIHEENPTAEELKHWYQDSGLPLKKFSNTSGLLYKSMQLKDKLPQMSEEEIIALLATDGMMVKRPILVMESEQEDAAKPTPKVLVGFKEAEWAEALAGER